MIRITKRRLSSALILATTGMLVMSTVFALDAVPPTPTVPTATSSDALEEVVVTANKYAETSNNVGMAISAFNAETLKSAQIHTVQDLTSIVPGFTVAQTAYGVPIYTLRGVGFLATNLSDTPTVGTYIDEVAYAYPYMARGPSFDMQQVEVLKGPQGTLYGRNTTGGLINLITNKPTDDLASGITVEAGNYETRNVEAYFNVPVTEQFKFRLSMRSEDSDEGWQQSYSRPDDRLGKVHRLGARGEFLIEPVEAFEDLFTVNYWRDRSDSTAAQFAGILPGSVCLKVAAFCAPGLLRYAGTFNAHGNPNIADWYPSNLRQDAGVPNPLQLDQNFYGLANQATWHIQDDLKFVALTSYNDFTRNDGLDSNGSPFNIESASLQGDVSSFQQELRLQGLAGPVNWMVGGYYAKDRITIDQYIGLSQLSSVAYLRFIGSELQPSPILNPLGYTQAQIATALTSAGFLSYYTNQDESIFAHGEWKLSDEFKFTGGIRYTRNDLPFRGCINDTGDGTAAIAANTALRAGVLATGYDPGLIAAGQCSTVNAATHTYDGLIPEDLKQNSVPVNIGFDWKAADALLVYGLISRGFKEGAIPSLAASSSVQYTPATQEQLTDYEGGIKLGLFDHRAQFNSSVFYYDYKNKQILGYYNDATFGVLNQLVNVPKSRAYGVDVDLTARPLSPLTVGIAATYVNTRVTDYSGLGASGDIVNYAGSKFPYAPSVQVSTQATYDTPISAKLALSAHIDGRFQSNSHADLQGTPQFDLPAYGVVNGSIGIRTLNNQMGVSLWVKNLADKYYLTTVTGVTDTALAYTGMPRTFGVALSSQF